MTVKLWGVRGSTPVPGDHTRRYGGNTTCVSFALDGKLLVIDAGTGIRSLGAALNGSDEELFVLLTHLHADHIIGFPFFAPLYDPSRNIHLLNYQREGQAFSLLEMFNGVHFPMMARDLPCCLDRVDGDVLAFLGAHGFEVTRLPMNHPGGAYGYRIEQEGRVVVFMPDNEIDAPAPVTTAFETFVDFCRGADVLIHDAQYLASEIPERYGWGHSVIARVCDLAEAAAVKHLVLFHHDPDRSDEEIDAIEARCQARLAPHGIECTAAFEGMTLDV